MQNICIFQLHAHIYARTIISTKSTHIEQQTQTHKLYIPIVGIMLFWKIVCAYNGVSSEFILETSNSNAFYVLPINDCEFLCVLYFVFLP